MAAGGPSGISSALAGILASEKKDKRKTFRRVCTIAKTHELVLRFLSLQTFIYRDEFWPNTSTLTLSSTTSGFSGPLSQLVSKYKGSQDFSSGVATFNTTRPESTTGREQERAFESCAVLDLDTFLGGFTDSESFARIMSAKTDELVAEWTADNAHPSMAGLRSPVERSYRIGGHTWRGKKRQEFSQTDFQLSSWGWTQKMLHLELPDVMCNNDVRVNEGN
jgi:hypothetical protein